MRRTIPLLLLLALPWAVLADSGRMYGTVVTKKGEQIIGAIRWDDEEVFWTDHFNGEKAEPHDLSELDDDDRDAIYDRQPGPQIHLNNRTVEFIKLFGSGELAPQHFTLEFGTIAEVVPGRGDFVTLRLRDGTEIEANGGSNDIGADIQVRGDDGSEYDIDWDDIEKVVFSNESDKAIRYEPHLYGTATTEAGEFTGVMQWDRDERFWSERLDGEVDGEDVSIAFGEIVEIHKEGKGSRVVTKDGSSQWVTGTNDVDKDNRGLLVDVPGLGRVEVPWKRFISVKLGDEDTNALGGYDEFASVARLKGTVLTRDKQTLQGPITFDIDEINSAEMISGRDENDLEYLVPIRYVLAVVPGEETSELELVSGQKLVLGADRDVNSKNNGIIVYTDGGVRYLSWPEIESVRFSHD